MSQPEAMRNAPRMGRSGARVRRRLSAVIALVAAIALTGCGTSSVDAADGPTTSTTATTTQAATGRLPPIIYRPAGLSYSQKVPLLIALYGTFGDPQKMEGLTHFEEVAAEHGFVVAYLASSDMTHPWAPTTDLPYISAMIDQITATQNIDPTRVYVTGFSAGGAETWRAGCLLSSKVAAIAVVSDAMSVKTLAACSLAKPVSELLIIGDHDYSLYDGITGRLPGAVQTTANWRQLDGCAAGAPQTQQISAVDQETWSSCTDGSAVGLYVIHGADHVWPPYGVGAPLDYPTSEEVWAFLSAHRAAPARLTSTDAKLLSVRVSVVDGTRRVMSKFRLDEKVVISEGIAMPRDPVLHRTFTPRRGSATPVSVKLPSATLPGTYKLLFTIRDSYGRQLTIGRTIRVPRTLAPASQRHR